MAVTKLKRKKCAKPYMADVYINGVKIATECFATRGEAYLWEKDTKESFKSGRSRGTLVGKNFTFAQCLNAYLTSADGFLKNRKSSQQSMEARMEHFSKSPIAHVQMKDFGAQTVDQWLDWILKHPTAKNPGRHSFKIELKYFAVILNWYRNFLDPNFIVPIVKRHRIKAVYKPIKARRPDYFIRQEDCPGWVEWLKSNRRDPVYYRLGLFQLLTGARIGEVVGLCWDAIDLDKGECRIIRTMSWDHWTREPYLVENVKTIESNRIIHLPVTLIKLLREIKKESPHSSLVFLNRKGREVRYQATSKAYTAGFEALKLPWKATHILRHTFGTVSYKATGSLGKVQAHMGHSDQKSTQIYAKVIALNDNVVANSTAIALGFA